MVEVCAHTGLHGFKKGAMRKYCGMGGQWRNRRGEDGDGFDQNTLYVCLEFFNVTENIFFLLPIRIVYCQTHNG